jgi:D-beta-D-heptose 7-phosphate kinase/D-beta-D-heptose 1-phosphate adenosyltransferase
MISNQLKQTNVLVLGDVMLDTYHYCTTTRKAPEADIPIYKVHDTKNVLGGASNVANNLYHLFDENHNTKVTLISVLGNDEAAATIRSLLVEECVDIMTKFFVDDYRTTTQKVRFLHDGKFVNRYDREHQSYISDEIQNQILEYISSISNIHAIVISDYGKGCLPVKLCQQIISYSNNHGILTYVDPKPFNANKYQDCFCFKPNLQEAIQISGVTELVPEIFHVLKTNLKCQHLVLTCDKQGMYLDNMDQHIQNYNEVEAVNVIGCGDVVLAILVYMYFLHNDLHKACKIANYVTTNKTIRCIGNYRISQNDIKEAMEWEYQNNTKLAIPNSLSRRLHHKVVYDYEKEKLEVISNMSNVVFTNGCFDIVHSAHLKLIKFAKSLGKILVLGLNSDSSIKVLKGESRPIHNESERLEFLSELDWIDYIVVFYDTTPYNILQQLRPNILVKGGDYKIEQIIGNEFVQKVVLFDYIQTYSTTNIIQRSKMI